MKILIDKTGEKNTSGFLAPFSRREFIEFISARISVFILDEIRVRTYVIRGEILR